MTTEIDRKNSINFARMQGHREGILEGHREGLNEGMEKGRASREIQIAKAMKERGIEYDVIASCTGLAEKQIAEL